MSSKEKGNLYIFITAFLWSLGGLILKYIPYSAMTTNGLRSIIAFAVLLLYRRKLRMKVNTIIVAAAICMSATNILYVMANQLTTAANAIVIQYTAPIWVLIWNSFYHKKRPAIMDIFTMILAFFGTFLFFFDGLSKGFLFGNFIALLSGISFSGVLFLNYLPDSSSEDSSMIGFLLSFVIAIPFLSDVTAKSNPTAVTAILVLGIFQVGLAYIFFAKGSRLTTPITGSLISLLETVMNPLWVFLFYGEKIGRYALFGAFFIIFAVALQIISGKEAQQFLLHPCGKRLFFIL